MTLKHVLETEDGILTISVDYDNRLKRVEKVNWAWIEFPDGVGKNITTLFIEKLNGDAIVDAIDWPLIYAETREANLIPLENE